MALSPPLPTLLLILLLALAPPALAQDPNDPNAEPGSAGGPPADPAPDQGAPSGAAQPEPAPSAPPADNQSASATPPSGDRNGRSAACRLWDLQIEPSKSALNWLRPDPEGCYRYTLKRLLEPGV